MKIHYYRNLPHIQPVGGTFFVTFRLKDSLPSDVLENYQQEKEARLANVSHDNQATYNEKKRLLAQFDDYLDRCLTEHDYLKQDEVARILMDILRGRDGQMYNLLAHCIMPNHVHLVIDLSTAADDQRSATENDRPLYQLIGTLKGYSSKRINEVLGRTGPLWQRESYDHLVRDNGELGRIIKYVLYNPVKAGLVTHWSDWPYTYLKPELVDAFT